MRKSLKIINFILCCVLLCLCVGCDANTYREATSLLEQEKFEEAKKLFEGIPDYEDSKGKIEYCNNAITYQEAMKLFENEKYGEAKKLFEEIPDFKDSNDKTKFCDDTITYNKAIDYYNRQEYGVANQLFEKLGNYKDSKAYLPKCKKGIAYNNAIQLFESGDFDKAKTEFENVKDFQNSDKYLKAMVEIKPYVATWKNSSDKKEDSIELSGLHQDYKLYGILKCKISEPFYLRENSSDEDGWCVSANVEITADYIGYPSVSKKTEISFSGDFLHSNGKLSPVFTYDNSIGESLFFAGQGSHKEIMIYFSDDNSSMDILESYGFSGTRAKLKYRE